MSRHAGEPQRNAVAAGARPPQHPRLVDRDALREAEAHGNFAGMARLARFVGLRSSGSSGEIVAACDRQRLRGWE